MQNFTIFMDRLAAAKTSMQWLWSRWSAGVKFRVMKISSEGLGGNSMNFCTGENFPLFGSDELPLSPKTTPETPL